MTDVSPQLALPYLQPAQAQKHVTVNEALALLDLLVQAAVSDRDRTVPPATPAEGDRHIVAAGATGAWTGQDGRIARFEAGAWAFVAPRTGWVVQVLAETQAALFDGAAWRTPDSLAQSFLRVGIATTADAVNRLAVASPATLLSHAGAGHQVKVNKAAPGDTASLLFQTGFSGRAEIGLAGDDSLAMKVSADGSAWATGLSVAAADGLVTMPQGLALAAGSAAGPGLRFAADADTGLFSLAADVLGLAAGGIERVQVTTAGMQVTGLLSGTAVTQSATDATAGRLVKTGDFGLATAVALTATDNLDSLTASGLYYNPSATNTTGNNYPGSLAGSLLNIRRSAINWVQMFVSYAGATSTPGAMRVHIRSQGGTGWSGWQETFHQGTILGTVSQSGGVPTGRVVERGANANGEFVRLADGTQICTLTVTASLAIATAFMGGFRSTVQNWTYPAAFAAAPAVQALALNATAFGTIAPSTPGTTSSSWAVTAVTSQGTAATRTVALTAIGRWF